MFMSCLSSASASSVCFSPGLTLLIWLKVRLSIVIMKEIIKLFISVLKICLRDETLKRALNTNPTFFGTPFMCTWYWADWRLRGPAPPPRSGSRGRRPGPGTSRPRPAGQHAHAHLQLEVFRPAGQSSPRQPAAPPLCPPRPRTWGRPGGATCPVCPWSWSACCSSQPPTATMTWGQCLVCFRE